MTDHINARVYPEPTGFGYAVEADGEHWTGSVTTAEEARAVAWASIRGIVRSRRLHAIKAACERERRTAHNRLRESQGPF